MKKEIRSDYTANSVLSELIKPNTILTRRQRPNTILTRRLRLNNDVIGIEFFKVTVNNNYDDISCTVEDGVAV